MEAESFVRDFVLEIVRPWAVFILLMRVGFWTALMKAITNVAEAEEVVEPAPWSADEPESAAVQRAAP